MDWIDYVLIALVIIVIILIIYYWWSSKDEKRRKHSRKLVDASAGGYDEYAQEALDEIEAIEPDNRTAEDNYRAGTILEFNLLNGETENAPRNILGAIMRNYIDAVERAVETARERREIVARAMAGQGDLGRELDNHEPAVDNIVIIDHIEDFTDRDFGDVFVGDIHAADMIGGLFTALFNNVTMHGPVIRETERETRRVRTAAHAENRATAVTNYLQDTRTHTSDSQNVHDSHVNEDLRATLISIESSLKRDTTLSDAINGMTEFLFNSDLSPEDRELVIKSLEVVAANNYIGTLQATEGHIFKCVWDRADDPANAANDKLIKEALATALAEFWENGADHAPVCINGRCSRMLAALVLLDYDDSAGAVQTKEMLKNEIIDDATKIINESIDEAIKSSDEARKLVGQSYKDPKIEVDEAAETAFVEELKEKITNMMTRNYRSKLSLRDFDNIKDDIFAGL